MAVPEPTAAELEAEAERRSAAEWAAYIAAGRPRIMIYRKSDRPEPVGRPVPSSAELSDYELERRDKLPDDEPTVVAELRDRYNERKLSDTDSFLRALAKPGGALEEKPPAVPAPAPAPSPGAAPAPAAPAPGEAPAPPPRLPGQAEPPAPRPPEGTTPDGEPTGGTAWSRLAELITSPAAAPARADIARGATEIPRQALGGFRDAVQSGLDLLDALRHEDVKKVVEPSPRLPEVKKATTVTGGIARSIAQFVTGYAAAGGIIGSTIKGSAYAAAAAKGALADFVAFDAHEKRLSDLVQEVPALKNPVTEFLASNPDDPEALGRFKRAVEGLGLGAMMETFVRAVRYQRDLGRARAAEQGEPPPKVREEAGKLTLLGNEDIPGRVIQEAPMVRGPGGRPTPRTDLGVPEDVTASALSTKGLQPLTEGDRPIFVNFARIDSRDDVKRVIADTAEAFSKDIDKARRGVRTNKETIEAAGGEDAWKVLMERRKGAPLNAEQTLAARNLWEASASKLFSLAEDIAKTPNPSPEMLFQFRKMLEIHENIQREVLAARTETARALQSWKIPAGGGGIERLASMENLLNTYGGPEAAAALARRVAALGKMPNGMAMLEDVADKTVFAKTLSTIKEVWVNALLSSPKTHVVNAMGNTASQLMGLVERLGAAGYSRALGSGAVEPGEAAAMAFAQKEALREGLRLAAKAWRTGESEFGRMHTTAADAGYERAISSRHYGIDSDNVLGKGVDTLGAVVNQPVKFLTASDDFYKTVAYRGEVAARAFRQTRKEVAEGSIPNEPAAINRRIAELKENPPKDIQLDAMDAAHYATFTQKPGALVQAVNQWERRLAESDSIGGQLGALGTRLLLPFRNTPANLLKYSFERTPLAPLMASYKEAVARGGADADIARARMALGTMVLASVIDLAMDGHITGAGPSTKKGEDKGTRQTLERSGWKPNSVRIGGRYYAYDRTDPLGLTLSIGSNIAEMIMNGGDEEDIMRAAAGAAATFGGQVLNRSYLRSMGDFVDILNSPDDAKASRFIKRVSGNIAVPNISADVRRQVDPYMRYSESMVDELRNRIPGLSGSLPMARDTWGRPRTFQSELGAVYDAVSPIYSKRFEPAPIDREAIKGDFNLGDPPRSLNLGGGHTISLSRHPDAWSRFLEIRGQVAPKDMMRPIEKKQPTPPLTDPGAFRQWHADEEYRKAYKRVKDAYGEDASLFDTLNKIVTGDHKLSLKYQEGGAGRNEARDKLITKIVGDFGKLAKWQTMREFPKLWGERAKGHFTPSVELGEEQ